jgi:predicted exporter
MFKLHNFLIKQKFIVFLALLVFVGIIGFLASLITLEEDISNLVPTGERQDVLMKVLDNTDFSDKIIVTISSETNPPDPEVLSVYAQQFLDSVNLHLPEYVNDIQGKVPEEGLREVYNFIYHNLPLFLDEEDYFTIQERLVRERIEEKLKENYKNLISPTGLVTKEFLFKDPLSLTGMGLQKLQELQVSDEFELYNNFLITKDQKHILLFISPALPASETDKNLYFVNKLQEIQTSLNNEFPEVQGEFFGGVLYAIANAGQIKKDIKNTLGIAGAILLLVLIYYYRRFYVPLLIFIPALLGGLTAIAVIYLLKGSISAISLGIGAILLGISIDYSLHILTHYKNNNNIKILYKEVTNPVLMSSTTTAIAFLCLLFLNSQALNDIGLFAAISVMTASVFALILIPLIYKAPKQLEASPTIIDKIASVDLHKKLPMVLILILVFVAGILYFTKVEFNNDLAALNFQPKEIKQKEKNVLKIAARAAKSIYLVSYGNSVDEALEQNNALYNQLNSLEEQGAINSYSSIGRVVLSTSTQLAKIEQWKEFWTSQKKEQVQQDLISKSGNLGFKPQSFDSFYQLLSKDYKPLYLEDYRKISPLYLDDFIISGENFATVTTSINVKPEKLASVVRDIRVQENVMIIDRNQINEGFLGNLKNEFNQLIGISIMAVFLVLLLFYRSLELTLLTLFPIGITWIITLGIMAILNIEFNILNIILSTFIFGLALDYSIFITNGFLKEYETGLRVLKTYRTSILLSVITTLLGIGALIFAEHPALRSISIISIIGVITAFLVAFVIQGYIFQSLFIDRKMGGKGPFSFKSSFNPAKYRGQKDKLYRKRQVYDNYRYKNVFPKIKKEFEQVKEQFLKVAEFLEKQDHVLQFTSGRGVLAVYLNLKIPGIPIVGIESDTAKLAISRNTFTAASPNILFLEELPVEQSMFNVFIISEAPPYETEQDLKKMVSMQAKKVIILDPAYSYRWLLDLNFEIEYRQNNIVLLKKVE